jgi:hypothetical protein
MVLLSILVRVFIGGGAEFGGWPIAGLSGLIEHLEQKALQNKNDLDACFLSLFGTG